MLPSNKIINDRSSSPSVKAMLNQYYHSTNREKLKEKSNLLQTVDDNSAEEDVGSENEKEENYTERVDKLVSARSSKSHQSMKNSDRADEKYSIGSFESEETHSSKKTHKDRINTYSKETNLLRQHFSKENSGIDYYEKATRPKSVPHEIFHDHTRSEQNGQNQDETKKIQSSILEGDKINEASGVETSSAGDDYKDKEHTSVLTDALSRLSINNSSIDGLKVYKAHSDIFPSTRKNVLNNESHDLMVDLNELKTYDRRNLKPLKETLSQVSNKSAIEILEQMELDKIETNEMFRKNRPPPLEIKASGIKSVQVDEYRLRKEARNSMDDRKLARKLQFAEMLAETLVTSAMLAGSNENITVNCLLLAGY